MKIQKTKTLNKRAQVDVALTVGAIIIPLAALMGSLVFAWAMISPLTDACKLAGVISHDIATLVDISYAVPDNVEIYYQPPSQCEFYNSTSAGGKKGDLTCLNGYMNISGSTIKYRVNSYRTSDLKAFAASGSGCVDMPASIEASLGMTLSPDSSVIMPTYPAFVELPAFTNLRDAGLISKSGGGAPLKIDNAISISKTREGGYDTLYPIGISNDFLYETVKVVYDSCFAQTTKKAEASIFTPHLYELKTVRCGDYLTDCSKIGCVAGSTTCVGSKGSPDAVVLCMLRYHQSPLDITSSDPNYLKKSNEYCFDLSDIPNSNCTYKLDASMSTSTYSVTGTNFEFKAEVSCINAAGDPVPCYDKNGVPVTNPVPLSNKEEVYAWNPLTTATPSPLYPYLQITLSKVET